MIQNTPMHSFHIPVMGLAFTIDTPVKVAHLGITSVVSITDDELMEKMRAFYCRKLQLPYIEITKKIKDYRAERVTRYLNLLDEIVKNKVAQFKKELTESRSLLEKYISALPDKSVFRKKIQSLIKEGNELKERVATYIDGHLHAGKIDVNIMTKVDKDNFENDEQLPVVFNDAHASLRGYANSRLESSVVLSAGMNPRLYSYFENFDDFYPDENFTLKKKITLKVSDYRSALIQGSFLAKKGLWVSEYRIESGLNCGGHAFATEGLLMGVILEEFKNKKQELIATTFALMEKALVAKNRPVPPEAPGLIITAQGGVGTAIEHNFLLEHYQLNSVGWGTPFLLVPEATTLDAATRKLLAEAGEDDMYLSNVSPLGVPFNMVKGLSNDYWKQKRIDENKAGSACPKKFLALSKQYDVKGLCTASKKYQDIKLAALEQEKQTIPVAEYLQKKAAITDKACLCVSLANAAYLENGIPVKGQPQGVLVCPGPNLAYFSREVSLYTMIRHIYGYENIITVSSRPHMFINELELYVKYLRQQLHSLPVTVTAAQINKWKCFQQNLLAGIEYYEKLFSTSYWFFKDRYTLLHQLGTYKADVLLLEPGSLQQVTI